MKITGTIKSKKKVNDKYILVASYEGAIIEVEVLPTIWRSFGLGDRVTANGDLKGNKMNASVVKRAKTSDSKENK